METIKLIMPTTDYIDQITEYKNEFLINNESIDGSSRLRNAKSVEEWLDKLKDNLSEKTVRDGLVPSHIYLAIRVEDNKIVGMLDIRHRLNDHLIKFGGHIGYSVRKSERRKGYAKEMLRLSLAQCKELKIDKALITCNYDNIGSAKTILANGGVLENEILDESGNTVQRYWIQIN